MEKMDMKTLRKGFTAFAEHYKNDEQLLVLLDENREKSSEEIVEKFVDDLATEKVLEYVNAHMEVVPAIQINVEGEDITNLAVMAEQLGGHHLECVRKLKHGKPMCKMGEDVISYGMNYVEYSTYICSYLTIDGEWVYAIRKDISEITEGDCEPRYSCKHTVRTKKESYYGLDCIVHLLDEKYQDFFEN